MTWKKHQQSGVYAVTPMNSDDLAIKVDPKTGGERWLLVGATGTGKSTAAYIPINKFYNDYVAPTKRNGKPRGRILIVDTKPRWRPKMLADGTRATRKYKHFLNGPEVPHSRLVSHSSEWDMAWETGDGVVLLQNADLDTNDLIRWCVEMMSKFFRSQKIKEPSLLVIDEGMDFFGSTGNSKYGDIVQRSVRAGREKGMATLICVQRPKTINLQVVTEASALMLFRIDFLGDMKRLQEMGIPKDVYPPTQDYHFVFWKDRKLLARDAMLRL